MRRKWYTEMASRIDARNRCYENGNDWYKTHDDVIDQLIDLLPHGSGVDANTQLLLDECKPYDKPIRKIVIASSYHAMNENGYYDGWYDFKIIITPDFSGIDINIKGKFGKEQDIKDYLFDYFYYAITADVEIEKLVNNDLIVKFAEDKN
jgi:hypothetical protein